MSGESISNHSGILKWYINPEKCYKFWVKNWLDCTNCINKKMENHGVMALAGMNLGFRSIYNSKRPIYRPEDVAGMKYRVIQNPLYVDTINSWGAKATPMNFGEVYTALQQGVIDAAGLEPYSYEIMKHYEPAPYFSISDHKYQAFFLTMSKKKFDGLPEDVQLAILDSAEKVIPLGVKITTDIDYRPSFAAALVTSAGGMGVLIPPCLTMVVFGSLQIHPSAPCFWPVLYRASAWASF